MNNDFSVVPEFASVSELQRNYAALLLLVKDKDKPVFILKKNRLEAVLLSPSRFESLMEKIREYEEKDALRAIKIYQKEKKAGKLKRLVKADDLFE